MTLNKSQLSLWGIIAGMIFIPLFILAVAFGGVFGTIAWAVSGVAWVAAVVIGILIIVDFAQNRKDDILYLIGGILLIVFPFIGAIVLLVDKLINK